MNIKSFRPSIFLTSLILMTLIVGSFSPVTGQDLVPVSDITGGSSVFVFRGSKSTRKFVTSSRATRTKAQRLETVKKIKKQYETLAKVQPRRVRSTVIDPENLPPQVKTMPPDQASRLFAGVGEYYTDQNDLENSLKFFREAVELDPKNKKAVDGLSDALAATGNDMLIKGQATPAKAFFQESLKHNPKNAAAYFGLGEVYSDLDQADLAIVNYEKAIENDPALTEIYMPLGILYFQKGEVAKADNLLTKALANASESAETQVFLGTIRYSQNRNPEAIAAFQRAKTLDPTYPEAFYHSGEALRRAGRSKDAITDYQTAVSLRVKYFDAWRGLGSAFEESGNLAEAINAYKQAARLKNDNPEVFAALGDLYRDSENYNEARSSYDLAVLFMSRNKEYSGDEIADVYSKIGFVIGRQCPINTAKFTPCHWQAAITALEKAVELGGGKPADHANLGWAYYNAARVDQIEKREIERMRKMELAKQNLQRAIAANPTWVEGPLMNLGMILTDLGDYAGAADALSKVVKKEGRWVFAINELGIAYRKQNNYKEAIIQFRKAVEKEDKFAVAHYNLGEAEYRNGNLGNAKIEYEKLKKLGRQDLADMLDKNTNGAVRK